MSWNEKVNNHDRRREQKNYDVRHYRVVLVTKQGLVGGARTPCCSRTRWQRVDVRLGNPLRRDPAQEAACSTFLSPNNTRVSTNLSLCLLRL